MTTLLNIVFTVTMRVLSSVPFCSSYSYLQHSDYYVAFAENVQMDTEMIAVQKELAHDSLCGKLLRDWQSHWLVIKSFISF